MNRSEFLRLFADIPDDKIHTLRSSSRLSGWPEDQSFYVELSKEFFTSDEADGYDLQRFAAILREMLYTDGRTMQAMLWIAEQAYQTPSRYGGHGLNALAGICNFLRRYKLDDQARLKMRTWMERFQQEPRYLAHNAGHCIQLLDNNA